LILQRANKIYQFQNSTSNMKQLFLLFNFIAIACSTLSAQNGTLLVLPEQPEAGKPVTLQYNPSGSQLQGANNIHAVIYQASTNDLGELSCIEIKLKPGPTFWTATFTPPTTTTALLIGFTSNDLIDNNNKKGYTILLTKNRMHVNGAMLDALIGYEIASYALQTEIPIDSTLTRMEQEFESNPALKEKYLFRYAIKLQQKNGADAKEKIKKELPVLLNKKRKNDKDYFSIFFIYNNILKDTTNALRFRKEGIQKFPKGTLAREELLEKIYKESDFETVKQLVQKYTATFPPENKMDQSTVDYLYQTLFRLKAGEKDYTTAFEYSSKIKSKATLGSAYNEVGWELSGQNIDSAAPNPQMARILSAESIKNFREELREMKNRHPYSSETMYRNDMQYSLGNSYDTYALIQWHLNRPDSALFYQEKAIELTKGGDKDMFYRMIAYLEKSKGVSFARTMADKYLAEGKSTRALALLHKRLCLKDGFTEETYAVHKDKLTSKSRILQKETMSKKIISETAPAFTLKNLEGKDVSLESMRGKIVILDFWAIWCGPCRASFPGMQEAQNKYASNDKIVFLYIDTWENKEPVKMRADAADFIKKNNYSFHVLLDQKDEVVTAYKVNGIPTKIIIGPDGNIRYKKIGSGDVDQIVEEITTVIELLEKEKK
jgi:thiol-disulfide isomerase/thioredoxin